MIHHGSCIPRSLRRCRYRQRTPSVTLRTHSPPVMEPQYGALSLLPPLAESRGCSELDLFALLVGCRGGAEPLHYRMCTVVQSGRLTASYRRASPVCMNEADAGETFPQVSACQLMYGCAQNMSCGGDATCPWPEPGQYVCPSFQGGWTSPTGPLAAAAALSVTLESI